MIDSTHSTDDDFGDRLERHYERVAGQATLPSDADDTLDDELRECLKCLTLIDRVRRQQKLRESLQARSAPASDRHSSLPKRLAHFEIERELGRGGAGIVVLATDIRLRRKVALKVPHPQFLITDDLRQRFLREVEASARLNHPHIVRVYEAGAEGPLTYLASEYCEGKTLADWLTTQTEPVSPNVAALIVRDLADAVQHAHTQAVIHRDIKPSNVLIAGSRSESVESIPLTKLCDFGLAKVLDEGTDQTHTGDLLGTPAYMAPEQAQGSIKDIDVRTDVYALGALLFELLTKVSPFRGETRSAILLNVIHEEAASVRSLRKDIPLDLSVIAAKCLSKAKEDRYDSAQSLAYDLHRFLVGEPIHARPIPWWERLSKWARRRPAIATAASLGVIFPLIVLGISLWANAALFEKNREIMQRLYAADMRSAKQAIDDYRLDEAKNLLAKYEPSLSTPDVRTLHWRLLAARMSENQVIEWKCHDGDIYSVDVSPDGKLLATASRDGTACLWEYPSGKHLRRLEGHQRDVNQAIFSHDGELLATCGDDGTLRLWEVATGNCRWSVQAHANQVSCLSFHPDGTRLLSGGLDHQVCTWRVLDGQKIGEPIDLLHAISALEFSPDGSSFFVATHEPRIARFQSDSMEREWPVTEGTDFPGNLRTFVIDPKMERILTGEWSGEIREMDLNGNAIHTARTLVAVTSIRPLPDGGSYVVTRENGRVELRESQSGESGVPLYASRSRVWDSRVVGSQKVAMACADGYLRFVSLPNNGERGIRTLARINSDVDRLLLSRDGRTLFAVGGNTLAAVDSTMGRILRSQSNFPSNVYALALSPDESLIATGEGSGRVCLWKAKDLTLWEERFDLAASTDPSNRGIESICFLQDENALLVGTGDTLVFWGLGRNSPPWRTSLELGQIKSIVQKSNDQFVVGCESGLAGLRRKGETFEVLFRDRGLEPISPICVKPGNEYLFVGDLQGGLHRVRQETGSVQFSRFTAGNGRRSGVTGLSMSKSGKFLALGAKGPDGKLCLVDTDQLSALSTTIFNDTRVRSTAFAPDEKTMFAGLSDGRIVAKNCDAFDTDTFVFPTSPMKTVKSSPDGKLAIIVDEEEWLKLYQTNPLERVPSWVAKDFEEASFSPDGSEIILAHKDRIHRSFVATLDETPTLVRTLDVKIKEIDHISHDRVVVRDQNDAIRIVELRENGRDLVIWKPDGGLIERTALSGNRKLLALGTTTQKIHLIDLEKSTEERVEIPGFVRSLAFTADGRQIALGDEHGSIHFFDIDKKKWGQTVHYPENVTVRAIAFTDADRTMLSASNQDGLQLWNLATGEIVYELDADVLFEDIAIMPAHGGILACGRDGGLRGILKMYQGVQVDK